MHLSLLPVTLYSKTVSLPTLSESKLERNKRRQKWETIPNIFQDAFGLLLYKMMEFYRI